MKMACTGLWWNWALLTDRDLCKIPFPPTTETLNTGFRLFSAVGGKAFLQRSQFVKTAKQVEIDAGDEAVFEFGIGEAVPLSEQDGFEHGQQGIGGTPSVVSKVTGSLTIQVLFDRLPINHLIQLQ